eukprot:gene4659-4912_t
MVDLREMYEKNGDLMPGKKGIMLRADQWAAIVAAAEDINEAHRSRNASYKLDLGNSRQVTVSEFKGTWYVGVREYYQKDGKMLPGQKGISMSREQWAKLQAAMGALTDRLQS